MRIALGDELSGEWSVQYRCHVQSFGWMAWAQDGEIAGSTGYGKRLEAIEVRIVPKGTALPQGSGYALAWADSGITASAHVQSHGWTEHTSGKDLTLGTTGQSKRIEAFTLTRSAGIDLTGDIVYSAHVQGIGWQDVRTNGQVAGTEGESRRVEAVTIELTGELALAYDVWYSAHVQGIGWMAWTKNGARAGTEGLAARMEALRIALLPKDESAPEISGQAVSVPYVTAGSVQYATSTNGQELGTWTGNGATLGSEDGGGMRWLALQAASDLIIIPSLTLRYGEQYLCSIPHQKLNVTGAWCPKTVHWRILHRQPVMLPSGAGPVGMRLYAFGWHLSRGTQDAPPSFHDEMRPVTCDGHVEGYARLMRRVCAAGICWLRVFYGFGRLRLLGSRFLRSETGHICSILVLYGPIYRNRELYGRDLLESRVVRYDPSYNSRIRQTGVSSDRTTRKSGRCRKVLPYNSRFRQTLRACQGKRPHDTWRACHEGDTPWHTSNFMVGGGRWRATSLRPSPRAGPPRSRRQPRLRW